MGRWIVRILLAPVALIALYLAAAVIGSLLPANAGWTQPADGVTVYVTTNGVHTSLVLPAVAAGVDWRTTALPEHLRDPRAAARPYLSFGWGDREFYVNTPSFAEMRADRVVAALVGSSDTVLHVAHLDSPVIDRNTRALRLRPEEYRRLAAFVGATFAPGGRSLAPGYGSDDAFYAARGAYSAFNTCNAWTGRALAAAGVRVGIWTPLSPGVMLWMP